MCVCCIVFIERETSLRGIGPSFNKNVLLHILLCIQKVVAGVYKMHIHVFTLTINSHLHVKLEELKLRKGNSLLKIFYQKSNILFVLLQPSTHSFTHLFLYGGL